MLNYKNFNVDFTNCDKEPIQYIGGIQPNGFLLVIDGDTTIIEQASENVVQYFPITAPQDLLGKPITEFIYPDSEDSMAQKFLKEDRIEPTILKMGENKYFVFTHESEGKIIIEGEIFVDYPDFEKIRHHQIQNHLLKQLPLISKIEEMGNVVAKVLGELLDYDRVKIIQFDKNWNSEVIAECKKGNIQSFLGHHFPASDIPVPARNLLLQKTVRQIPNSNAHGVDIIPYHNPSTGRPSDLLNSELRSPSEIHLEYVRNMGVASTISFSILVKGKLWGIITCHNVKPAFINYWKRQICEQITHAFGLSIGSLQKDIDLQGYKILKHRKEAFIAELEKNNDLSSGLSLNKNSLLSLTLGTGAALILENRIYLAGITPKKSHIDKLVKWLATEVNKKVLSTCHLSKFFPMAVEFKDVASGLLALEISRYNGDYLLFFKPEIIETRIWAGNPAKPTPGKEQRIHPRKSFEKWKEVIKGKSQKWSTIELDITKRFVKDLTAIQLRYQASKLKKLNTELDFTAQRLAGKNSQLKDFGLIMAHNLRGPMSNIVGLNYIYEDNPSEANAVLIFVQTVDITKNMLETLSDLNVIIETGLEDQLPSEKVNLEEIVQKEWQSLKLEETKGKAIITTDFLIPSLNVPKFYLESILHNFISNALKYRSPERNLSVVVKSWREKGFIHLSVADNGLGMDLKIVGDKVFGLYKTFHKHGQSKGIGLYLTKMQIEKLGGEVSVQSEPNVGTTFTISFPLNLDLSASL